MNRTEIKESYFKNLELIEKLEMKVEEIENDSNADFSRRNTANIWKSQIESLKALNKALGETLWALYDETIY